MQKSLDQLWRGMLTDYVTAIAWFPKGQILAASSAAGEVVLWREPNELLELTTGNHQSVNCLGISPDEQFLAAGGQDGNLRIWQVHSPTLPLISTLENKGWVEQLAWSPTQNQLAFSVGRQVKVWNAQTQGITATFDFEASSVLSLAWHPDGKYLAVSGHTGVNVWNIEDPKAEPYLLAVPGASLNVAWSSDGNYLASGNLDRTLTVLQWQSPPPWLMQGFPGKIRQLAWSESLAARGNPRLATACVEGIVVWERESKRGGGWESRILEKHEGFVEAIAFQPGTELLASAAQDGRVYLWHQAKRVVQTLNGAPSGFSCLAWNPQGEKLAAGGRNGELLIWRKSASGKGFGGFNP